jgi:hypothetical protein
LKVLKQSNAFNLTTFASSSADFITVAQDLLVFGTSSFNNATVQDTLSIGNSMHITENSIDTIGQDLSLQSLRQGNLDIMGGAVIVTTDGTLKVNENAEFAKDVLIKGVLSASSIRGIDDNLTVSGSATFEKINVVTASSSTITNNKVTSNGSAGKLTLKSGQTDLIISNNKVSKDSLIFITPTTGTDKQPLYISAQADGKFTVSVDTGLTHDADFNYLIVN